MIATHLRALRLVTGETLLLLKRDRVFLPALFFGIAVVLIANLASDWSVEEFSKILFDVGAFGFQLIGSAVAIFWGVKSVSDSRQQGALEVQLAAPIGRAPWLVGKFLGLALALSALFALLLAVWQAFMLLNDFGMMTPDQLTAFGLMLLGWLVLAATATMFASFCGQAIAMFATLSAWIVGLASALVAATLSKESPDALKLAVRGVARLWDLQQFLVVDRSLAGQFPGGMELGVRASYGGVMILILITVACIVFSRRDAGSD